MFDNVGARPSDDRRMTLLTAGPVVTDWLPADVDDDRTQQGFAEPHSPAAAGGVAAMDQLKLLPEVSNDGGGKTMRMNAGAAEDRAIEHQFLVGGQLLQARNGKGGRRIQRSRCIERVVFVATMKHADRPRACLLQPMSGPRPHPQPDSNGQ